MRTYAHTHTPTYIHTCIHAYMHACIHTYIHTCIHIHAYIRTYIHTYIEVHMNAYTDTCLLACLHARMHACIHVRETHSSTRVYACLRLTVRLYLCTRSTPCSACSGRQNPEHETCSSFERLSGLEAHGHWGNIGGSHSHNHGRLSM